MGDNGVGISIKVGWRVKRGDSSPVYVGEVEITCNPDEFVWGDAGERKLLFLKVVQISRRGAVKGRNKDGFTVGD